MLDCWIPLGVCVGVTERLFVFGSCVFIYLGSYDFISFGSLYLY